MSHDLKIIEMGNPRAAQALADYLLSQKIAVRVEPSSQGVALVLGHEADMDAALKIADAFIQNPNDSKYLGASWISGDLNASVSPRSSGPGILAEIKVMPFTLSVVLWSVLVLVLEYTTKTDWFALLAFPDHLSELVDGQWWRLVTPIFIHGGMLHIGFNAVLWWLLATRLEQRHGAFKLMLLTVILAVGSNGAQLVWSGQTNFGGLSGVVFGLVTYCWALGRIQPTYKYVIAERLLPGLLIWQVLCFTPLVGLAFGAEVANGAHLGGLLIGLLLGAVDGCLARFRHH